MVYFVIGIIVIIAVMPYSIRNLTKYRQEKICKKAKMLGIDLNFEKTTDE